MILRFNSFFKILKGDFHSPLHPQHFTASPYLRGGTSFEAVSRVLNPACLTQDFRDPGLLNMELKG